jgi:hypothetical protein
LEHKNPVSQIADFLCRTRKEIRDRARDLGHGNMLVEQ